MPIRRSDEFKRRQQPDETTPAGTASVNKDRAGAEAGNAEERAFVPVDYKPPYFRWYEEAFWSDPVVNRGMNWLERHLYRALLCSAFFCETRPYLPDDDDKLWILADAESPEMWKEHRRSVLRKFESFTDDDGRALLRNKRICEEWSHLLESLQKKSSAGLKSAAARARASRKSTGVQHTLNKPGTSFNKLQLIPESESKSKLQVETEEDQASGVGGASTRSIGYGEDWGSVQNDEEGTSVCHELLTLWREANPDCNADDFDTESFAAMLNDGIAADEIKQVLVWLPRSNYWGKPGNGQLDGLAGFRRAYKAILKSYQSYRQTILDRKRKGGED